MIYMFRNEMKKWHTVLWVVFASLAIGSGFGIFYKRRTPEEAGVGSVDGQKITFKQLRRTLKGIIAPYTQLYGMSEDKVMSLLSRMGNLEEVAFNVCVEEKLLDRVQQKFAISIDGTTFNSRLAEIVPPTVIDENGKVNMESYQRYLQLLATTPSEFEKSKEDEFKRELIIRFAGNSNYTPKNVLKNELLTQNSKKNFEVLILPQQHFISESKKAGIDENALVSYFSKNKENYRVSDKAMAKYWEINVDEYEKKISIDDEAIKNFYNKNKTQLYRIPPKIKVRKIVAKDMKLAQELHQKAKQNPTQFAKLATENSVDKTTAKNGGLVDFFSRGKYDTAFETAAFKLKAANEVSDIIKTKDGYEIIQLVERIKAEEKPLEVVKNEIIATLRSKRAIAILQGDLGTLMHDARANSDFVEKFAAERGLKEHETGWISEKESMDADINGQIAQKVLSASGRESSFGHFKVTGKYILYKTIKKEKSYLPELNQVKDAVISDYYKSQTELLTKNTVAKIKNDILNGKSTLRGEALKLGLEVITTGLIKKDEKVSGLSSDLPLIKKMFILNDKAQVLQDKNAETYYLVQLVDEKIDKDKVESLMTAGASEHAFGKDKRQVASFIASLHGHSKIDMDKKALGEHKNRYSKED